MTFWVIEFVALTDLRDGALPAMWQTRQLTMTDAGAVAEDRAVTSGEATVRLQFLQPFRVTVNRLLQKGLLPFRA